MWSTRHSSGIAGVCRSQKRAPGAGTEVPRSGIKKNPAEFRGNLAQNPAEAPDHRGPRRRLAAPGCTAFVSTRPSGTVELWRARVLGWIGSYEHARVGSCFSSCRILHDWHSFAHLANVSRFRNSERNRENSTEMRFELDKS